MGTRQVSRLALLEIVSGTLIILVSLFELYCEDLSKLGLIMQLIAGINFLIIGLSSIKKG